MRTFFALLNVFNRAECLKWTCFIGRLLIFLPVLTHMNICISAGSAGDGFGQREEGYGDETLDYSTEGTRASPNTWTSMILKSHTKYRANQKIVVRPMRTSNKIMLLMLCEMEHPSLLFFLWVLTFRNGSKYAKQSFCLISCPRVYE